jgi:uncharacterized repeat protein (TIGR03803 family)
VAEGVDSDYYGTTGYGGSGCDDLGCGVIYKITTQGMITSIYDFGGTTGPGPSQLALGTDGYFYGAAANGEVFKVNPQGSLEVLANVEGDPQGPLVEFSNGDFYGTTSEGGNNNAGTVFKITPEGGLTILYKFCSQADCPDGSGPSPLTLGTDGNFYGTTGHGGADNNCDNGCGTIFQITSDGILTTLHSFCVQSGCPDGSYPMAIMQGTDGNFYGITLTGGANDSPSCDWAADAGCGTVFRLSVGLQPFVRADPAAGKIGAKIRILGTSLTGATSVTFDGTAAQFTVKSKTLIIATVPSAAATGTVEVQLPNGTLSSNVPFIVLR